MKSIRFIRHAESLANAGGVSMPNALIPLSDCGAAQAQELARILPCKPSQVLISGFLRTRLTAVPFCSSRSISWQVEPLLNEFCTLDPALIAGLDAEGRRPIVEDYWHRADPALRMGSGEAESLETFVARVEVFLERMDDLPDGTLLFGHGMWLAMLIWRMMGFAAQGQAAMRQYRQFQLALPMPNCAQYVFRQVGPGHWAVRYEPLALQTRVSRPTDPTEPGGEA